MNEAVIQEIANQLGIATDQAAVFIQTYLPQYAALKVMQNAVGMSIFTLILVVAFTVLYRSYKFHATRYSKSNYNAAYYFGDYVGDNLCVFIALIILGFASFFWLIIIVWCVPEMIGWIAYPEAQLISDCMSAIKQ